MLGYEEKLSSHLDEVNRRYEDMGALYRVGDEPYIVRCSDGLHYLLIRGLHDTDREQVIEQNDDDGSFTVVRAHSGVVESRGFPSVFG